jgi:hypothetical protein
VQVCGLGVEVRKDELNGHEIPRFSGSEENKKPPHISVRGFFIGEEY